MQARIGACAESAARPECTLVMILWSQAVAIFSVEGAALF